MSGHPQAANAWYQNERVPPPTVVVMSRDTPVACLKTSWTGADVVMSERVASHGDALWREEFLSDGGVDVWTMKHRPVWSAVAPPCRSGEGHVRRKRTTHCRRVIRFLAERDGTRAYD